MVISCGSEAEVGHCWCMDFPSIMPAEFDQDCRCKSCLAVIINERIQALIKSSQLNEMIELSYPFSNKNKLIESIDYCIENSNYVFSAWYHLKRGHCCGNACRNCPYKDDSAHSNYPLDPKQDVVSSK